MGTNSALSQLDTSVPWINIHLPPRLLHKRLINFERNTFHWDQKNQKGKSLPMSKSLYAKTIA